MRVSYVSNSQPFSENHMRPQGILALALTASILIIFAENQVKPVVLSSKFLTVYKGEKAVKLGDIELHIPEKYDLERYPYKCRHYITVYH